MGGVSLEKRTRVLFGKPQRLCGKCGVWQPLDQFKARSGICRLCTNARHRQLYAEGRFTKPDRQRARENQKRNREQNRERRREQNRRYREGLKANPERLARYNELRRMAYRERLEQEGRPLDSIRPMKAQMAKEPARRVALAPLREAFLRSELTPSDVARRVGYERGGRPDTLRVRRVLGLTDEPKSAVNYDVAMLLVRALDIDPASVGV